MTTYNSNLPIMGDQRQRRLPPTTGPYNPNGSPSVDRFDPSMLGGGAINQQLDRLMGGNVKADVSINTAPPGSAIEQYYKKMLELMPTGRQSALGDAGSILGSFASDQRTNRAMQGNAQQGFDALMLDREANRNRIGLDANTEFDRTSLLANADHRDSTSDAMQKIQLASYLQQGGLGGGSLSHIRPVSDMEKQAAGSLSTQMMGQLNAPKFQPTRFTPDNSYNPMDPSKYSRPGTMEKIGQYGGMITGGMGILDKLLGGGSGGGGITSLLSKIPGLGKLFSGGGATAATGGILPSSHLSGNALNAASGIGNAGSLTSNLLGKALPIAGIAAGSYGLMKDRGLGGNMLNGAQTGAGIGTMVMPGLGTAIGAGIGAGAGALRGVFGVSEQEKRGRQAQDELRNALTANATPQQQAEAQASGQGGNALMHIVLRDTTGNDAQAGQLIAQLNAATKQGPEAVAQVLAQFQGRA